MACISYLVIIALIALIAPIVLPHVAAQQAGNMLETQQGPSWHHLLGTDTLGRDVLQRLLVGTRVTIAGVAEALVVVIVLGVPLGLAAGFLGGWVDRVVGWLADLTFSMPTIVVVIVVLTVLSQSMLAGMVAFGVLAAPGLMRVARSATLPVRQELYIAAARVSGLSRTYIARRHVLPRIAGPLIVQTSLLGAAALIMQTGLAFLGLLVAPPAPSWGGMVANGLSVIELHPWLVWPPGIAIALTILAFGLLGDAVRDATAEGWSTPTRRRAAPANRPAASQSAAISDKSSDCLLSVDDLRVGFETGGRLTIVVDGVSFGIANRETVGLVGESGCGKSMTAMSIIGLLPPGAQITRGSVAFRGRVISALAERELRRLRGRHIGYVSQEPMISFDPAFTVGSQLVESVRRHRQMSRRDAKAQVLGLLGAVRLPDPAAVFRRYSHQLSGGMAQRVAIARALAGEPELLIADEPTTALDVTVQAEILALLRELQAERGMAILLITHDWGVVADLCDRALVMYAGELVEVADVDPLFQSPLHPYTEALLASSPYGSSDDAQELPTIPGTVPRPGDWPLGCHFCPRCRYALSDCAHEAIPLVEPEAGRETRCLHYDKLSHD